MRLFVTFLLTSMIATTSVMALNIGAVKDILSAAHHAVDEVDPAELKKMIDEDEEFILIDIRGTSQQQHGEIYQLDGLKIERGYLEFKVEPLIPNKKIPIVIYCCTGKRGILAAKSLKDMGYQNVRSLKGGIRGWVEEGMPLDTAYGEMIMMPMEYEPPVPAKEETNKGK
ncbi:MAG: rhodanese-like domain-containing protein [Campylobacterota bacterium]|nr:rhodanese-like domain-containing protein [Campylobacterota bacterium]